MSRPLCEHSPPEFHPHIFYLIQTLAPFLRIAALAARNGVLPVEGAAVAAGHNMVEGEVSVPETREASHKEGRLYSVKKQRLDLQQNLREWK